jgi:heterodisulfide reductase subunit A
MTLCEVSAIRGEAGDFAVEVIKHPRYVDMAKCIACGTCAEKCPKKVNDLFNENLITRKAAYVEYPQAVPLKYAIDKDNCIYFQKGKCRACEKLCPTKAINFEEQEEQLTIHTGAVILAPGFRAFDPGQYETYAYARHPNVITSMEFERILSATGPYQGHLVRPSDHQAPRKIAWLQCVGSRDVHKCDHGYCSAVCCMYAVKEAVIAKEHAGGDLDCAVFFMDMRTHGKDFERYYDEAKEKQGVRFIRSRVPTLEGVPGTDDLLIPYVNEKGEVVQETFDLVVLSVGLETAPEVVGLAAELGIALTEGQFCLTDTFRPVATSREGIYVCGTFQGPKDIPQSVIEASSAAAEAGGLLREARNTLTRTREIPPERTVSGERPRVGVFVCQCGINIGGVVNVAAVRDYASSLPYVEYVTDNLFSCSTDTQESMAQVIKERGLNRIVVAACTPKTHEPLFQETLVDAGLNKYLFEMTNIRNQDSWVHKDDPEGATLKAQDLVRMAVAKVALMEPLEEAEVAINPRALVVGGGIAGMVAARTLSGQGYEVSLVEREGALGGQARKLFRTWKGEDIQGKLGRLIKEVDGDGKIRVHLETQLVDVTGFVGNFSSTLRSNGREEVVEHGIAVIATGAGELKPDEYLYGEDARVVTHLELDQRLMGKERGLKELKTAVFIQCVGSREPGRPYCSRVCCTHAIESALHLKELNPEMNVYVLYRDIRTYGEREYLYQRARLAGILFIQYSLEDKPRVTSEPSGLRIEVMDRNLAQTLMLTADLVVLASAIVGYRDEGLAQCFKVPMNADGFFVEAHAKLGPSEFATDGVFLCGMAHYPKPIDESVAQAQAACSRAVTLLARERVRVSGMVARVSPVLCSGCGVCVEICPYRAPSLVKQGVYADSRAEVNPALCKGCGLCVASCRSGALNLRGFEEGQIMAMINAM